MPKQKDLKRHVRARMDKTGESYTTARAQLLRKKPAANGTGSRSPKPADYAKLAGMSDAAVKAKTGCTWEKWVSALDRANAQTMPHRDIAKYVHDKFEISGWWAQTVTVGYERIRGLRDIGQRRDGAYEANKSKTVPVHVSTLYKAFTAARRGRWLGDVDMTVRTSSRNKSMRITWPDGTSVHAYFIDTGPAKSAVQIQHVGLPKKGDIDKAKAFWDEKLGALTADLKTRA